jgi:hypothetical protein
MWFIYTMEFYSAVKNNVLSFVTTRMELEVTMLNDINQTQEDDTCDLTHVKSKTVAIMEVEC